MNAFLLIGIGILIGSALTVGLAALMFFALDDAAQREEAE